ncbi:hypothetical protein M2394_000442 [Pseudomonas sp. BIGb0164]|nr:hypothetical protein [Pseudomonas sp. BIGb0164]
MVYTWIRMVLPTRLFLLVGETNGLQIERGNANVTGFRANGNEGVAVFLSNDNHIVGGNDLSENDVSGFGFAVTPTITHDVGNLKV